MAERDLLGFGRPVQALSERLVSGAVKCDQILDAAAELETEDSAEKDVEGFDESILLEKGAQEP